VRALVACASFALVACQNEATKFDKASFDPSVGAEFRDNARAFLRELNPLCELTEDRGSVTKIAELKKAWLELKRDYQNKPVAVDIAISEADHKYEIATSPVVECPPPDVDGSSLHMKERLTKLAGLMAELSRIASEKPKQAPEIGT
jgi:hypothetical protein